MKKVLHDGGLNTNVGDEGGFAPDIARPKRRSISSSQRSKGRLQARRRSSARARPRVDRILQGRSTSSKARQDPHARSSRSTSGRTRQRYPIVSIEDGMAEDDWDGWKALTDRIGRKCSSSATICSSPTYTPAQGIETGSPIRSSSRSIRSARSPKRSPRSRWRIRNGYTAVISHRSGETEDTTIADLAVATNCGQIKTGSRRAPTASRSTTSFFASKNNSARRRNMPAATH